MLYLISYETDYQDSSNHENLHRVELLPFSLSRASLGIHFNTHLSNTRKSFMCLCLLSRYSKFADSKSISSTSTFYWLSNNLRGRAFNESDMQSFSCFYCSRQVCPPTLVVLHFLLRGSHKNVNMLARCKFQEKYAVVPLKFSMKKR